jgi:hypothetical protein
MDDLVDPMDEGVVPSPAAPPEVPAETPPIIRFIRLFLFAVIVVGVVMLVTESMWVPIVVDAILASEGVPIVS